MEYDPHTEQLTVHGPVHARLVLGALGVSYANSDKVQSPYYTFILDKKEFGTVMGALDQAYINDIGTGVDHTDGRILSDALFHIVIADLFASLHSGEVY